MVPFGVVSATRQSVRWPHASFYFVTFPIGDATRERVGGGSRLFDVPSQAPQTVIYGCFGSCTFFGGSSATFLVRTSFLVCVRRFTLEFGGPLTRLLQVSTCCFMKCTAVANLPEGAVQFCACIVDVCARSIVKGPAVGDLHGGGDHTLTRELHVLQTVLVLLGLNSKSPSSRASPTSWCPQRSRIPPPRRPVPAQCSG